MSLATQLVCLGPQFPLKFAVQAAHLPAPGAGMVQVRVLATSVNPIDAKRATGYGKRLLAMKGAARFPLVLGNDVAGIVEAVGPGVKNWRPGDHVYGLLPTGAQGAHASRVLAQDGLLRAMPANAAPEDFAALPYIFTTLWLALQGAGLDAAQARGKRVLVHGASGGLGQLALQVLAHWGARTTAVCRTPHTRQCLALGACDVLNRDLQALSDLPRTYDASLNFAAWQDEAALLSRLKPGALGHATTVHPLLSSLDTGGWLKGSLHAYRAWRSMRRMAGAIGPGTRYAWTIFRPSSEALDALAAWTTSGHLRLTIGMSVPFESWQGAFAHVAEQRPGRAILLPA